MDPHIQEILNLEGKMGSELINGLISNNILEHGKTITLKVKVNIHG